MQNILYKGRTQLKYTNFLNATTRRIFKGSNCPCASHEGTMRIEVIVPLSLTLALDGVSGEPHAPAALRPVKAPPIPTESEAGWGTEPV
jgi:hypothetical protein